MCIFSIRLLLVSFETVSCKNLRNVVYEFVLGGTQNCFQGILKGSKRIKIANENLLSR